MVHPVFDPIAIQIGFLSIHWYGLMYLVAFGTAFVLGRYRIKTQPWINLDLKDLDDILFYGVFGVIIGGRLGYVLFYKPNEYLNNPLEVFFVWEGGMSFHGGLLGVLIAIFLFCWTRKKNWFSTMDFIAPLVPLGLAAGRLGNFINGELWGRPTDLHVGMVFPFVDALPRHPSQLYQFFLEGILLFILIWVISTTRRPVAVVSASFLILYGVLRFIVEFTREPDNFLGLMYLDLSMGQWLSIPMVLSGTIILILAYRSN